MCSSDLFPSHDRSAKGVVMMYLKSDVEFVYEDVNDDLSAIVPDPVV